MNRLVRDRTSSKPAMAAIMALCASLSSAQTVIVAAAANLQPVAPELSAAFAADNPGMRAEFRFGSTGALAAQIRRGSPDGVFLAADMSSPSALAAEGKTAGPARAYARGRLVLFMRNGIPLGKGSPCDRALAALGSEAIRTVAIADPKTAPYGTAAAQAISAVGVESAIAPKIVYASNISQAAQYALGAADAAFIAASSLRAEAFSAYAEGSSWCFVDPGLYGAILQGMVLIAADSPSEAAKAFSEFMLGGDARSILERAGYGAP